MIDATIRLIYNPALSENERRACRTGAGSFNRFDIRVEETVAGPNAGRLIRNGPFVSSLVRGDQPFRLDENMFRPFRFNMSDTDTRMLVIGITPYEMNDGQMNRFVVGKALAGAVVSLADLRKLRVGAYRGIDGGIYSETIEKLTERAMGLALLEQGCGSCVMQNVAGISEFISRIAQQRLEFCDPCVGRIKGTISSIKHYGMA